MFVAAVLLGEAPDENVALVLIFGIPLVVCWLLTKFYCRQAVRCPHCGASLWGCGTGNFKPRRMKVRKDVTECPTCHTPIM